ncbi:hypothetical protein ACFXGA_35880 [Actinosynnema sp. NPDC059335]|uniref:hypothetical protein n=1 Tax=Actinosynnema sp. NPDC059335 TaxID=3346804 RepID=UPI00366B8893
MSSTPIYDELAATYLADLIPDPGDPAEPDHPVADGTPTTTPSPPPRGRPEV